MALPRALQLRRHFQRVVLTRPWLTFVVMALAFFVFGLVTLDLLHMARANADFLLDNGVMGLVDGGALQLLQIVADGLAGMLAYVVMKTCEHTLSHWLADPTPFAPSTDGAASDPHDKH